MDIATLRGRIATRDVLVVSDLTQRSKEEMKRAKKRHSREKRRLRTKKIVRYTHATSSFKFSVPDEEQVSVSPLDSLVQKIGFASYDEYLRSEHWKNFTARVRRNECYCCKKQKALQVHHMTYKNIGAEMPEDVVTVCRACHTKIHNISREGVPLIDAHDVLKWNLSEGYSLTSH
jgi:hypothetical protein